MDNNYRNLISSLPAIRVAIVGKDPFPTNPTGVPFCKPTWSEQLEVNSSGFYMLNSIGISETIRASFPLPIDCFNFLASNGVVFLNLSYDFIGVTMRKGLHQNQMHQAFQINRPIMQMAEVLLLCGEAKKNRWNDFVHPNSMEVVHPDYRNSFSRYQSVRDQWNENWGINNALNRKLNLDF